MLSQTAEQQLYHYLTSMLFSHQHIQRLKLRLKSKSTHHWHIEVFIQMSIKEYICESFDQMTTLIVPQKEDESMKNEVDSKDKICFQGLFM